MPSNWSEIRAWREFTRSDLIKRRLELSRRERRRCDSLVAALLRERDSAFVGRRVAFYWPLEGEISLVTFMRRALPRFEEAALPVVVQKETPLEFWRWSTNTELVSRRLWHMPSPSDRILVKPDILLVPLVGFDEARHRLGYGGGYYDRTLATLSPRPVTIGIGYEMTRLSTIHPQPHDIPLDVIVTEDGVRGALNPR